MFNCLLGNSNRPSVDVDSHLLSDEKEAMNSYSDDGVRIAF